MFDLSKEKGQDFHMLVWSRILEESHVGEEGYRGNVRDVTFNVKC